MVTPPAFYIHIYIYIGILDIGYIFMIQIICYQLLLVEYTKSSVIICKANWIKHIENNLGIDILGFIYIEDRKHIIIIMNNVLYTVYLVTKNGTIVHHPEQGSQYIFIDVYHRFVLTFDICLYI